MNLLVAGSDRVDAGKTTFSVGLLEHVDGTGFKPRGANDYWFDHDDYRRAASAGRLFGNDARKLAAASPDSHAPETCNPIHRLWRPAPDGGGVLLGQQGREFVLDRVADRYVVNDNARVPAAARENLPLSTATRVASVSELNEATERLHLPALDRLATRIRDTERAVVESYADVALPVRDVDVDAVAVVEPGRARIYDGSAYVRAHEAAATAGSRLETRIGGVLDRLDAAATVSLPALTTTERDDPAAVAEQYEVAYDALLATAFG
jgi:predicted P-loop ATPase/GTPase